MVAKRNLLALMPLLLAMVSEALPSFQPDGNLLVMSNGNVTVNYDLGAGTADFYWQRSKKISAFYAGVTLSTGYVSGLNFSNRTWQAVGSNAVAVTAHAAGWPDMIQYFTLDQNDSFLTRVAVNGVNVSANWMGPVVMSTAGGVDLGITNDNRALFVPFDNDHFVSYNSESMNGSDTGNEVGAFYDNTSRNGLVVGSVTHDTWKTGVYWSGSNNKLDALNVFGGVTSHWTWDVMPHGSISGSTISSPTIFVGFGADWRVTMENFADENARFAPRLAWTNGVPFGWNSWGVTNYQNHISYSGAIAVADSIHTNLQRFGFSSGGTVYVNLDSYWNNLWTDYGGTQLQNFVAHCHANGQKAGIYFTPFAYWGSATDATNYWVPVGYPPNYSLYRYSDILLRDNHGNFITNDGALAIDPTHPGAQGLIDYYVYWFTNWGFDYVKLDFLSHGALEGVHYDPAVTTGIQAYNQGMRYLLNKLAGKMFISESIAPIFPYQYAHSRRIACDAQPSKISNTAYTMNAVSLGWWISGRLYQFNDPDLLVFDNGPDDNEVQSRLINGAITGVFLNGSILTNAASIHLAQTCLTNAAINAVARVGQTFRPVDGASGTGAANILARQNGSNWCIAVFNYTSSAASQTVDLNRAGLPAGTYVATNLWDGTVTTVSGSFNVSLNAKQARLFSLAALVAPPVITNQPAAYTNSIPMYAGVPITLSVAASGSPPEFYQWYQIAGGTTNALAGATSASFTHRSQSSDTNGALNFFVVVSNSYGSATSSVAALVLSHILAGPPAALSVQFTITNYAGFAGGLFLAPADTAGVYAVSNWNVFAITPGGGTGTQPGVAFANLVDRFGVMTPAAVSVVNVSDGWHQTADTITAADTANARLMNTFWKTHNDSSPLTNVLYTTFNNLPRGNYSAYLYLMQNNAGATGYVYSVSGGTNFFREYTTFNSASNFVTAVDTTGAVNPFVNYLKLTGLGTDTNNSITLTTVWTGGADGIGVCGVQLVPPVTLAVGSRTNGQFRVQFPAPDGQSYVVETSSNLARWLPVVTNAAVNGQFIFINTNAARTQQFYRVRQ
jgi:hypothetical protein